MGLLDMPELEFDHKWWNLVSNAEERWNIMMESCLTTRGLYVDLDPATNFACIDRLINDAPKLSRVQLKWRYEGIDNDITRGMLAAESKVWASRSFKYELSPDRDVVVYCLRYWRIGYSNVKNSSTSHKALGWCVTRAELSDDDNDPLWDIDKVFEKHKDPLWYIDKVFEKLKEARATQG
jgi:hypothetical protein